MIRSFKDNRISFTNLNGLLNADTASSPYVTWLYDGDYVGSGATIASVTGGLSITGTGSNAVASAVVDTPFLSSITNPIIGHKYYIRLKAKVTNAICSSLRVVYGGITQTVVTSPTDGTVYDVGVVITATATTDWLSIGHVYSSAANANGKVMEAYSLEIIDLTVDCGAGLEYTAAQMSAVFALNIYTYFIGTYSFSLSDFTTNGDKVIQPISCIEILQDNVDWRIELEAPLVYQPWLLQDYILMVPTKENGVQPFRVKNVEVDGDSVNLNARHVGYDLENYICSFIFGYAYTSNTKTLMQITLMDALPQIPFTFDSDAVLSGRVVFKGENLLANLTEIITTLGGHLTFNGWSVRIDSTVGTDNGVTIEYGKNLSGSKVVEDWNSVCTTLLPVGNNNLLLPFVSSVEDYLLHASGVTYDRPYYRKVTFQTDDVTELTALGNAYLEANKYPKLNYTVEADTVQDVGLGDTIAVKARQFSILTNVLGYTFNVNTQRIVNVEFGNFRKDVRTVFSNIQADITDLKKQVIQENITMNSQLGLSCMAYKNTTTTVNGSGTNGGVTKYVLDTTYHNTDTTVFELTGGSIKVLKAGVYLITAMNSITSGTAGERINAQIAINGGTPMNLVSIGQIASTACRTNGSIVLVLNANDTIDLNIYNSSTASKSTAAGVEYNFLSVTKQ